MNSYVCWVINKIKLFLKNFCRCWVIIIYYSPLRTYVIEDNQGKNSILNFSLYKCVKYSNLINFN